MPKFLRNAIAALLALTMAFALSGCAAEQTPNDGRIRVVSATAVWASVAAQLGGPLVVAQPLLSGAGHDPHSYEATARDQLKVNKAQLLIVNGGGYDTFLSALAKRAPANSNRLAIDVAESAAAGNAAGNEHFWYSLDMVGAIAKKIAQSLTKIDPAHAGLFATNLTAFDADLNSLASELEALAATNGGKRILATEPLADYLTANAGLIDATPSAFKAAIEGETDAPLLVVKAMREQLAAGRVAALVLNAQTASTQVSTLVAAAKLGHVPVVEFNEFQLDSTQTYINWMSENIRQLAAALAGLDPKVGGND